MPFKINKSLEWLAKSLGRSIKPGESDALPSFVEDGIGAQVDVLGWERYSERQTSQVIGAATVDRADSLPTPNNVARLVTEASGVHGDTVTQHALMIQLVTRRNVTSGTPPSVLTLNTSLIELLNGIELPITRRVLLLPGDFLRIRSNTVLGATFVMALNVAFIDIEIGEYTLGVG